MVRQETLVVKPNGLTPLRRRLCKHAQVAKAHAVSSAIRAGRKRLGLTQEDLAETLGVHPMTVSEWERGVAQPKDVQIEKLAELLDTTPAALRYGANGSQSQTVRESPAEYRVPAISRGLPKSVRVWLHGFLLELAGADVPDEQIESVKAALTSQETFSFFVGKQPSDYTDAEIIDGLKALALAIRNVLRERGYKIIKAR